MTPYPGFLHSLLDADNLILKNYLLDEKWNNYYINSIAKKEKIHFDVKHI